MKGLPAKKAKKVPKAKKGLWGLPGTSVIARVRTVGGVVTATGEEQIVPLTDATWTQHAGELNPFVGQITVTSPSEGETHCSLGHAFGPGSATIEILLAGAQVGKRRSQRLGQYRAD